MRTLHTESLSIFVALEKEQCMNKTAWLRQNLKDITGLEDISWTFYVLSQLKETNTR